MTKTFPGMTVEVAAFQKGCSVPVFDGIFAAGGITLSQVSIMTGLEPYMIQNWVKRGFVAPPQKRTYSPQQLARITIINMLRETLPLDTICGLIHVIGGDTHAKNDDLISDDELYHRYVNMLAEDTIHLSDSRSVREAAERAAADFEEPLPGARRQLIAILQVMLYAHAASRMRGKAEELLSSLE